MRQRFLLQSATAFLLQSAIGITKCDNFITKCDRYYKVRRLLQSATVQRQAAKRLKNKKSPFVDKIRNEMIKASLEPLMAVYVKLFDLILQSGKMPDVWCQGLITPIYKSGDKSDPTNYRGICVSSCLGKLFCSILNRRLHLYFEENKILHNSQIGFLPENRTADHVFTLRTLIDKYVHYHKEKVYACFVDFRKAFDSVWHEGLFYKLLKTNIGGNLYNLMKSLYCNSTCSIKIGENKTQPFSYSRGVRQGCILSPLLFNLYLKNLPHLFENTLSDPFVLPNGKKTNSLFYADDLVILSRSKTGLQNCLNALSLYCDKWKLKINPKKTEIMIFQKRPKKSIDIKFNIGSESIEIVQQYTYLGTRLTPTGNFTLALEHLTLRPFTRCLVFGSGQFLSNIILILHPKFLTPWYSQS